MVGSRGGTAGGGKRGKGVQFIKPAEPSFLRKLKEQVGYKEPVAIDAKREYLPTGPDEDQEEMEDERPTVVVLKDGDLSQEEADRLQPPASIRKDKEEPPADGKIVFKKPKKREAEVDVDSNFHKTGECSKKIKKKKDKVKKEMKNLLSFDDEDDES